MAEDGTGQAQHCPYATNGRERIQDGAGRWHSVEARDGHRADLTSIQWIGGQITSPDQQPRREVTVAVALAT